MESDMKIVTINIPDQYLDCIESMVNLGFYPSRSEAVREALKQFIVRECQFKKDIDPESFKQMKKQQMGVLMR
jgi:Arc/MetJ-type ribon-helix-helix transcriptional regulator